MALEDVEEVITIHPEGKSHGDPSKVVLIIQKNKKGKLLLALDEKSGKVIRIYPHRKRVLLPHFMEIQPVDEIFHSENYLTLNHRCQPNGGANGKVRKSPKSSGFTFCTP